MIVIILGFLSLKKIQNKYNNWINVIVLNYHSRVIILLITFLIMYDDNHILRTIFKHDNYKSELQKNIIKYILNS